MTIYCRLCFRLKGSVSHYFNLRITCHEIYGLNLLNMLVFALLSVEIGGVRHK
jgi:hypothetical protein